MPVYEFICKKCGKRFDVDMKISEYKEDQKCPECTSIKTKRVYTFSGIDLSKGGSGIYKNDYK